MAESDESKKSTGVPDVEEQKEKAAPSERGRFFLFVPTKERVTVVRENVGKVYDGTWVHEVVSSGEGRKFLASVKQLKEIER
jgi:hypothetical protein